MRVSATFSDPEIAAEWELCRSFPVSGCTLQQGECISPARAILSCLQWRRWWWLRRSDSTTYKSTANFFFFFNVVAISRLGKTQWSRAVPETSTETVLVSVSTAEGPISAAKSPLVSGKGAQGRESFPSPPFCDNKEPKTEPRIACCQEEHKEKIVAQQCSFIASIYLASRC